MGRFHGMPLADHGIEVREHGGRRGRDPEIALGQPLDPFIRVLEERSREEGRPAQQRGEAAGGIGVAQAGEKARRIREAAVIRSRKLRAWSGSAEAPIFSTRDARADETGTAGAARPAIWERFLRARSGLSNPRSARRLRLRFDLGGIKNLRKVLRHGRQAGGDSTRATVTSCSVPAAVCFVDEQSQAILGG